MRQSARRNAARCAGAAILAGAVLLAGCGAPREDFTNVGFPASYGGGVAADEARAASVGLAVLRGGGHATDAAIAMTFALAVTYPAEAGLGGGGVCVMYDAHTTEYSALDFLPRADAGAAVAVPGIVRGMEALYAVASEWSWEALIAPAETLAREGTEVSRPLAAALATAEARIRADPQLAAQFTDGGTLLREGQVLRRIELAALLAQVRSRGAGDFYTGQAARTLLDEFGVAGLTAESMRAYRAEWSEPAAITLSGITVRTAVSGARGGVVAGQLWAMLQGAGGAGGGLGAVDDAHWFAEASARAYGDRANPAADPLSEFRAQTLMGEANARAHTPFAPARPVAVVPGEPGAASFVAADVDGSFTTCTLTMGQAFGAGTMGRTSGIALSLPPRNGGATEFLAPVLATRDGVAGVSTAVAASGIGGPAAVAGMLRNMNADPLDASSLATTIAAPRLVQPGAPDEVWAEPALAAAVGQGLAERGHTVRQAPALGLANAVACRPDRFGEGRICAFAHDPRGFGVSAAVTDPAR